MTFFNEFGKKWASEGSVEPISETQKKSGWDFLGSVPPISGQFNLVQQNTDEKINYLFNLINSFVISKGGTLNAVSTNALRDILNNLLMAVQGGHVGYATKDGMLLDTTQEERTIAEVLSDPVAENNGFYLWLSGEWVKQIGPWGLAMAATDASRIAAVEAAADADAAKTEAQTAAGLAVDAQTDIHTNWQGKLDIAAQHAETATTQAGIATDKAVEASGSAATANAAKTAAELARDAAMVGAVTYPDEATGRAAVADGEYFKVIGSGDVAAREYQRTNASASVLVAEYPSTSAVTEATTKANAAEANAKDYTDVQLPTVKIGNLYSSAKDVAGFYMISSGLISANADSILAVIELEEGKTYAVEFNTFTANQSIAGFKADANITAGQTITPATLTATDKATVKTFTVPTGKRFVVFNLKVGALWNTTSKFIVNEGDSITSTSTTVTKEIYQAHGAEIVDTKARQRLTTVEESYLSDGDIVTKAYHNLIELTIDGYYINNLGQWVANASSSVFAMVVEAGKTYAIEQTGSNAFANGYLQLRSAISIDPTKTSGDKLVLTETADAKVKTFTIPADAMYKYVVLNAKVVTNYDMRTTTFINEGLTITDRLPFVRLNKTLNGYGFEDSEARSRLASVEALNPNAALYNKKWVVMGDSITQLNGTAEKPYHARVAENVGGMQITNTGIGGYGYYNLYDIADTLAVRDADFYTIMYGTNDWGRNDITQPLGQFGDKTADTIAGCVYLCLQKFTNQFYKSRVGVLTPLPRSNNYGLNASPNSRGFTLLQLVDVIKQTAAHFSIPCLDLYRESNLNSWDMDSRLYYFAQGDGLHPNDLGHAVFSPKVKQFLLTMAM